MLMNRKKLKSAFINRNKEELRAGKLVFRTMVQSGREPAGCEAALGSERNLLISPAGTEVQIENFMNFAQCLQAMSSFCAELLYERQLCT